MADDRPPRKVSRSSDHEVIDYYFKIDIHVTAAFDEKRMRKLVDDELQKLKAAVASKKP